MDVTSESVNFESDVGMNMTEASMEVNSLPNKENDLEYNEKESKRIKVDNWSSEESKGNIQKPVAKKSLFTFTHSNILTANLNSFSSFFVQHVSLSCAILLTSFQFMPPPFNCLSYLFFPSYLLCLLISFVCLVLNVLVCYRIII
uniref:Uncharacterized protein n=1 Tax=Photinus pyralis TaxID=7054 RepID=A0A1Y1KBW5_PHOPY